MSFGVSSRNLNFCIWPCTRITGGEPVVRCRSDPPDSTRTFRNWSIWAMLGVPWFWLEVQGLERPIKPAALFLEVQLPPDAGLPRGAPVGLRGPGQKRH